MNLGIISGQICPLACTYCIIQFQHHSKTKYLSFFSNSVQKLVNAFITSSMDNCNLFLSGHSKSSLKSLHLIILINSPQWDLQSGFNWHCSLYWQILLSSFERKQKGNKRSINGTEWNLCELSWYSTSGECVTVCQWGILSLTAFPGAIQ